MNYAVPYRSTTLAQAGPGACVLIGSSSGQLYLALTVRYDDELGIALIDPPTVDEPYIGTTSILTGSAILDAPTWVIDGARAVPSGQSTEVKFGYQPPPGALVVRADGIALSAIFQPDKPRFFDMASGQSLRSGASNALWFSSWSIEAPVGGSDKMQTVRTIKAP